MSVCLKTRIASHDAGIAQVINDLSKPPCVISTHKMACNSNTGNRTYSKPENSFRKQAEACIHFGSMRYQKRCGRKKRMGLLAHRVLLLVPKQVSRAMSFEPFDG